MKNSNPFGVGMPCAGIARVLHISGLPAHAAHPAHAGAARAPYGTAAQPKRRTAATTDASVDGGTI